jgi:integrase
MKNGVTLYIRHRDGCTHDNDRNYRKCGCPVWVYNPDASRGQQRKSTGTNDWNEALKIAATPEPGTGGPKKSITVDDAVRLYLAKRSKCSTPDKAPYKDKYLLRDGSKNQPSLLNWASGKHFSKLEQITAAAMDAWRDTWVFQADSYSLKVHNAAMKKFFTWAVNFDYLTKNPFDRLESIKVTERPTLPLEPEEISKMLACIIACQAKDRESMTAFQLLVRWSGLAIVDASCLRRDALGKDNRLRTYRKKTGEYVYLRLPEMVADALRAHANIHPDYVFWCPEQRTRKSQVHWFEDRLRLIYNKAGISPRGAHRFRDTFSVEFLNSGGSIEDLAMLLGHSSTATTWKHYAPWVKSRQIKLDAAMERSLVAQGIMERMDESPNTTVQ